jgi:hypothetical protein
MKRYLLGLGLVFVLSNCLFAQTKDLGFRFYIQAGLAHSYKFKLNSTLTDIGYKKIPDVFTFGLFGISYDIKNQVEIAFEGGVESMGYGKKTRLVNIIANLSVGYILTLSKEHHYLIFAGNFAVDEYNVYAYQEKGSLNFQNPILINSNMFHLRIYQFMVGPKITWRSKFFSVGIGYDFGVVPTRWKSDNLKISNSSKERIDKIHLNLAVNLAKY